jgi:hypothetical protein
MNLERKSLQIESAKDGLSAYKATSANIARMTMTALIAPLLHLISRLEKIEKNLAGIHKRTVQRRVTQRLIRRRIIDREIHLAQNLPGWDAPIYR